MKKHIAILSAILLLSLVFAGCSGANRSNSAPPAASAASSTAAAYPQTAGGVERYETATDMGEYDVADDAAYSGISAGSASAPTGAERKLVRNMDIVLETLEYDQGVDAIRALTGQFGGFVQASRVAGKSLDQSNTRRIATFTIRIPANQLDSFLDGVSNTYNVLDVSEYTDDYSDQYYDTEARLRSLRLQAERLEDLLSKTARLQDLFEVEKELASVRYEIEVLTGSNNKIDNLVSLSTVNITLREVVEYQESVQPVKTFGQELGLTVKKTADGFVRGCQVFLLILVGLFPYLIIIGLIVFVTLKIVWRSNKKRAATLAARQQQQGSVVQNWPTPAPPTQAPPEDLK